MAENFFTDLEDSALRALLSRTALRDTALITVGPSLHMENCNEAARQLTGLHPMERADQVLSDAAADALQTCLSVRRRRRWR